MVYAAILEMLQTLLLDSTQKIKDGACEVLLQLA